MSKKTLAMLVAECKKHKTSLNLDFLYTPEPWNEHVARQAIGRWQISIGGEYITYDDDNHPVFRTLNQAVSEGFRILRARENHELGEVAP